MTHRPPWFASAWISDKNKNFSKKKTQTHKDNETTGRCERELEVLLQIPRSSAGNKQLFGRVRLAIEWLDLFKKVLMGFHHLSVDLIDLALRWVSDLLLDDNWLTDRHEDWLPMWYG